MTVFTSATLEVELTAGVWTAFTSVIAYRVAPVVIRQGRPTEFDDVSAGVLTVTLFNDNGDLMPDNPAGAYYPNWIDGKRIRFKVTKSGTTYTRFVGWIQAIEPSFPTAATIGATVTVTAVDSLGIMAQRTLRSNWVENALYRGRSNVVAVDVVEGIGGSGQLLTWRNYSEDASPGVPYSAYSATSPDLALESSDQLSIETVVTASPDYSFASSKVGIQLVMTPQSLVFWVKFPGDIQAGANPNYVLSFKDTGGSLYGDIRLQVNGGQNDLNLYNAAGTFKCTLISDCTKNRWYNIRLTTGSTATTTDCFGVNNQGTLLTSNNVSWDLRSVVYIEFPHTHDRAAKASIAGVAVLAGKLSLDTPEGLTGLTNGTIASRVTALSNYLATTPILISSVGSLTTSVCTGSLHGRSALEVGQELSRSGKGVLWAGGLASIAYFFSGSVCRPAAVAATIDTELDCIGAPTLVRGADGRPTRVDVQSPATRILVIDTAGETALSGAQRLKTVTTVNASQSDASAYANLLLAQSTKTRIKRVVVDLLSGATDHTAELLSEASLVAGLFPTQRLRFVVPTSHFGVPTKDYFAQGWEERWSPWEASIAIDTTPAVTSTIVSSETFTGSNGSGFSAGTFDFRQDVNGAGTAVIQSNRGRITTAAASTAECWARFATTQADIEIASATFNLQNSASRAAILTHSSSLISTNGYMVVLGTGGTAFLYRNGVLVASWSETIAVSTDYTCRVRSLGGYYNVRVWATAGSEPGTWDSAYVDSSPLAGTRSGIGSLADGVNNTARAVDWDNVSITDGA